MRFTAISRDCYKDYPFAIHREGCKDIAKEHGHGHLIEAESAGEAAELLIDGELREMGYNAHDVKVFPCCKGASK